MTETKDRVFSVLSPNAIAQQIMFTEIARTLFFARIAQLNITMLGKAQNLSAELKDVCNKTTESIRGYDQKMRALVPKDLGKQLTAELAKDKMYDIANLVESVSKVSGKDHEAVLTMMTEFIEAILKTPKINIKKYGAIFRAMSNELKAENNGITSIHYAEKEDIITFKLEQPKIIDNGS